MSVKGINFKHGHTVDYSETREYNSWMKMKERCYNKNCKYYADYGGRGVIVCDRWLNSFSNFFEDMGNKPTPHHSLDRYPDNNGIYELSNCRWATMKEQANNRRSTLSIKYNGEVKSLKSWSDQLGLKYKQVHKRIHTYGWSIEKAFSKPIRYMS